MLNRSYEQVVVGSDYLATLLGLVLARQGQQTLIIEDPDVSFGNELSNTLGALELLFLSQLGKKAGIYTLRDIERFTAPQALHLVLPRRRFCLGLESRYANLKEWFRQYGHLSPLPLHDFCPEKFRDDFESGLDEFAHAFVEYLFEGPAGDRPQAEEFLDGPFLKLFHWMTALISDSEFQRHEHELTTAIQSCFLGGLTENRDPSGDLKKLYLFASLLGPRYQLQSKEFKHALEEEFREVGGDLKQTRIQSWQIHQGRIQALLLASFEGVIAPENLTCIGHPLKRLPFLRPYESETYFPLQLRDADLRWKDEASGAWFFMGAGDILSWSELYFRPGELPSYSCYVPFREVRSARYFQEFASSSLVQAMQGVSPRKAALLEQKRLVFSEGAGRIEFKKKIGTKAPLPFNVRLIDTVPSESLSVLDVLRKIKSFPLATPKDRFVQT